MSKRTGSAKKKPKTGSANRGQTQMRRLWSTVWIAIAAELFLLILYQYYVKGTIQSIISIHDALPVLMTVFPVAAAICLLFGLVSYFLKRQRLFGIFRALLVVFLALWAADYVVIQNYAEGIKFLCTAVAVVAVLVLVFFIYQREFFLSSLVTMGGIAALWVYRRSAIWGVLSLRVYVVFTLGLLLLLLCVLMTAILQRNKGVLTVRGVSRRVFSSLAEYRMIYLSCAVVAALMIASFFLGNLAAYVSMFALAVYFFALAVYSTVKLM